MRDQGAYSQKDAAAWIGLSVNHFKKHVRPYLHPVYIGGAVRYRTTELQRFLDQEAS